VNTEQTIRCLNRLISHLNDFDTPLPWEALSTIENALECISHYQEQAIRRNELLTRLRKDFMELADHSSELRRGLMPLLGLVDGLLAVEQKEGAL